MTGSYPPSARTSPSRNAGRISYDRAAVHAVLDEALVCHVGFVVDGQPVALPQLHARVDDKLYLHGSTGARGLRAASDGGLDVCVTATLTDGLVLGLAPPFTTRSTTGPSSRTAPRYSSPKRPKRQRPSPRWSKPSRPAAQPVHEPQAPRS